MRIKTYRVSMFLSVWLLLTLLVACGDSATPTATTITTSAPTTTAAAKADPTSTPIILPTIDPNAITTRAATAIPTTLSATTAAATAIRPTPTAPPTPKTVPTGLPGKLSVIGNDAQVYIERFDGKGPQLTLGQTGANPAQSGEGRFYNFPTWSRDGQKLAVMAANLKAGLIDTSDVWVVKADGSGAYKVRDQEKTGGIYISFAPDGNSLTMLVGGTTGLDLQLADTSAASAGQPANPRKLKTGQPLYTSWSSDNDTLLIHTTDTGGDTLSYVSTKTATAQPVSIPGPLGGFRAPAWSNDGSRMAYIKAPATSTAAETLVVAGKDGKEITHFDGTGGAMSFNWSPDDKQIAFSTEGKTPPLSDSIYLVDLTAATPTPAKVVNEPVLAYFWSPDNKKLAYITINSALKLLSWNVYDVATKKTTPLLDFVPSDSMTQALSYFDQYAQSDSFWSPDSKSLVFAGWEKSLVLTQTAVQDNPFVYVVSADGATQSQFYLVGPGELAYWSK